MENGSNDKLTNKQIAITRLVTARFLGFQQLEIHRIIKPNIFYLVAVARDHLNPPYRYNICALGREKLTDLFWIEYEGKTRPTLYAARLPLSAGVELVENFYTFLTYNTLI